MSVEQLFGLAGRNALVIGASSGLGAEAARALAKAGADVGIAARRVDRLEIVASELRDFDVRTCVVPTDVTSRQQLEACVEQVDRELGPIDILVYAPGISPLGRAERHPREKWDAALAINLTGAFEAAQCVASQWIERGRPGRILFLSSVIASGASPVHPVAGYVAAKSALNGLTRQLAVEWASKDICVNAIAPGYFETELTIDPRSGTMNPETQAKLERLTPLGRIGRSGEIESAVVFLCSPSASYVTGAIVPVDGGWTAW
jgi:NAD(P)-dependent dehydrogenase (short-subunit alcohol dehydrogenase family)